MNPVITQVPEKRWVSYLRETAGLKFQLIHKSSTGTEEKVQGNLFFLTFKEAASHKPHPPLQDVFMDRNQRSCLRENEIGPLCVMGWDVPIQVSGEWPHVSFEAQPWIFSQPV